MTTAPLPLALNRDTPHMKPVRLALAALLALSASPLAVAKPPPSRSGLETYVLLDRTGSMEGMWREALASVNAYAEELGEPDGGRELSARVTLATFDAQDGLQFDVVRDHVDPSRWRKVTNEDATPRGMTPLYDAIGRIVALAEEDQPRKAVIVIMTDGEENSSRELTREGARAVLDRVRRKGWEVVFLGAEFANFEDAEGVGNSASRNMAVSKDALAPSMQGLARKSKGFLSGEEKSVEFSEQDRAAAKEEEVKQRQGR